MPQCSAAPDRLPHTRRPALAFPDPAGHRPRRGDGRVHRTGRVQALHRRPVGRRPVGQDVRVAEPLSRAALGPDGRRVAGGRRRGGRSRPSRVRQGVGEKTGFERAAIMRGLRRRDRGQRRAAGPAGGAGLGQAAPGDARPAQGPPAVVLLLLRPRRQARGPHHPAGQRRTASRTRGASRSGWSARSRRGTPAAAADVQARAAAGRRQHLRLSSRRNTPRRRRSRWPRCCSRPACLPAC